MRGIFLMGNKGIGKSSIVKKLMYFFPSCGFLTFFDPSRSELFLQIINGKSFLIARRNLKGKMEPVKKGFDLAAQELVNMIPDDKLLIIDELGSLELCCKEFQQAVKKLLLKSKTFLCVIQQGENEFIESLLKIEGSIKTTVTEFNRDSLAKWLMEKIGNSQ